MKKAFVNFGIILVICLVNSSCSYFSLTKAGPPSMHWMYDGPPPRKDGKDYHPMYVDGWVDGCETGVSANTNSYYKWHYKFKQDANKALNTKYYKGWKDAFNYCGRYMYQYHTRVGF